jgi:hypothetical protein
LGSDIRDFFTATVNASSGIVMNRLLRGTVALTFLSLASAITIAGVIFLLINYGILHSFHSLLLPGDKREETLEEISKFFEWDSNHRISSSSGDGEFASKQSEWGLCCPGFTTLNLTLSLRHLLHLIGHDGLSIVDEAAA